MTTNPKGQHTPEPWSYDRIDTDFPELGAGFDSTPMWTILRIGSGTEGAPITTGIVNPDKVPWHEANARRIVACVNACAGISTKQLEFALSREVVLAQMLGKASTEPEDDDHDN